MKQKYLTLYSLLFLFLLFFSCKRDRIDEFERIEKLNIDVLKKSSRIYVYENDLILIYKYIKQYGSNDIYYYSQFGPYLLIFNDENLFLGGCKIPFNEIVKFRGDTLIGIDYNIKNQFNFYDLFFNQDKYHIKTIPKPKNDFFSHQTNFLNDQFILNIKLTNDDKVKIIIGESPIRVIQTKEFVSKFDSLFKANNIIFNKYDTLIYSLKNIYFGNTTINNMEGLKFLSHLHYQINGLYHDDLENVEDISNIYAIQLKEKYYFVNDSLYENFLYQIINRNK